MQLNWVDWVIVIVCVYALIDGWQRGLLALIANLVSFLASLYLAVRYHTLLGNFLMRTFGITLTWTGLLGYLIIGFVSELVIETLLLAFFARLPERFHTSLTNTVFGSLVSLANSLVVVAFVLLLAVALPLRGTIKNDIQSSVIAREILNLARKYGGQASTDVENLAKQATKFLTVEPGSKESIPIDVPENTALSPDTADETAMVAMVNHERTSRGIAAVSVSPQLHILAEEKSRDMFVRGYFSHYAPDGTTLSDRLKAAGIPFDIAGENIAYAPDLMTAENGFMQSPGHRANILDPKFHEIGIGIISAGYYGMMFTQEFTD